MTLTDIDRLNAQKAQPRAVELWKALQPLKSCVSFMNTGAHPDDEDTAMLAVLGLREGIKLSHACSTRGEGGQNNLGVETIKNLGTIRTREMERAAAVLDITQYWLSETPDDSIFDFGFSKSGDETLGKWNEERTIERFVHILRRERPDIICPTFLDVPGQHGHHRAMTRSAFRAVELAADPNAYPEQGLKHWQVKKIYLPAESGAGDAYDDDLPPPPTSVVIDATDSDPVIGADYAQIAQWSRAFHATQGMGRWIDDGVEKLISLHLAWAVTGNMGDEADIKENLPSTLADLAEYADAPILRGTLLSAQDAMDNALKSWPNDDDVKSNALQALALVTRAINHCPDNAKDEVLHRLAAKKSALIRVLALSSDMRPRLTISQNTVRAGDVFEVKFTCNIDANAELVLPEGWTATPWNNGFSTVTVDANASPSNPYPDTWFPDRANSELHVKLTWQDNDQTHSMDIDPEERLNILPAYSAELSQSETVININDPKALSVNITRVFPSGANATLGEAQGWDVSGDGTQISLQPKAGLEAGLYEFPLSIDGQAAEITHEMSYPHIGDVFRFEPAVLRIRALDVALPDARIAYVGGGSDQVDDWLRKVGMDVTTLDDDTLESVDFSTFDTVLIGIFALRTRPILSSRLKEIHDWVHAGGNLVTLYHRPWDNWDENTTALAPLRIGKPSLRWRVTDENAAVTYLEPDHKLLNSPNKITQDDWAGWHKERGLYFAANWGDAYKPLLSMTDPDESALTGSLLTGQFGKGRHTHTSLILHHQLEKLVPGAYRLLANLLA